MTALLISLFARWGVSQALSRVLGYVIPIGAAALCVGLLWARGSHYEAQRDAARAQVSAANAKLAVSNASIAELQHSLSAYVGAGQAAKVAQLASIEKQAKDNAALQAEADAIRAEMAKGRAEGCASPESVTSARGL
jgi:hypothetical protein